MSLGMKLISRIGLVLCLCIIQGVLGQDFSDPETIALTIGCAIGFVIVLIILVTLCAYCYIKEDEQHRANRQFDYNGNFPNFPTPRDHHSSLVNGHAGSLHNQNTGSLHNSQTTPEEMAVPPGIWTTNPSMHSGVPPPNARYMTNGGSSNPRTMLQQPPPQQFMQNGTNGPFMVNGTYGMMNGVGYGTLPPQPAQQYQYQGSNPRPTPRNAIPTSQGYPNGYYTAEPPRQQNRQKKSLYQRTIGRLKGISAVFQVKQSSKETLSYKKLLAQQEAAKQQQQPSRHKQNGHVAPAKNYDVTPSNHDSRTSSELRRLPRNGAVPTQNGTTDKNSTLPPRYSQYEQHEAVDVPSMIGVVDQEPAVSVPDQEPVIVDDVPSATVVRTSQHGVPGHEPSATINRTSAHEPQVAKAFSDYREPADALPVTDREGLARAFSSYEHSLNTTSRTGGPRVTYGRQESEHKYALPQDAIPSMVQSEFTLNRVGQQNRVSRTESYADQMRGTPFVASKYSNYVHSRTGSAGPVVGRVPGQRGILIRSPSDLQRLGNYRSQSLERYASQYTRNAPQSHNIPQHGRTRAEIIRDEKAAKEAAKQNKKSKQKSKPASKEKASVIAKPSAAPKHQSKNKDKVIPQSSGGVGMARSYQTVPGSKINQGAASTSENTLPVGAASSIHIMTGPAPAMNNTATPSRPVQPSQHSPSSGEDDPFALYARPKKVKQQVESKNTEQHDIRPMSIDVPSTTPAPYLGEGPESPLSPEPPEVPPHPEPATPKTPRSRKRNKSESASRDFALAGDDVTSSAFKFLEDEDLDTDHDASFNAVEK